MRGKRSKINLEKAGPEFKGGSRTVHTPPNRDSQIHVRAFKIPYGDVEGGLRARIQGTLGRKRT